MNQDPPADDYTEAVIPADEIRARAHDIWERHHRPVGFDMQFWFMAERELKAERRTAQERHGEATPTTAPVMGTVAAG